jgi:serine/threonine protein kinase/tetratricopeptide (TPR) repeat protein
MIPARIGPYRIERKLGEGGMGIVYEAQDERLGRQVAIKMLRGDRDGPDREQQQKRLWREARVAARMNHPNLCQIHDVVDHSGTLLLVMELLQGSTLSERLKLGPLPLREALPVMQGILAALQELHRHQIIHRDLKPSNVFLAAHGIKVLDFGLAQGPRSQASPDDTLSMVTLPGLAAGTPRYMSPEQLQGAPLTAASDLFAAGCVFYEVLTAKPAFDGDSIVEVISAVLHRRPPALTGSPDIERADMIVRRALEKQPSDRFASAEEMAAALPEIGGADSAVVPHARSVRRLIALPFRMLRPDPDTDFLAFSLPDAIACSLTGLDSIVVRSTMSGGLYDSSALDVKRIAAECGVDVILAGNLVRAGSAIRVTMQLIEAPSGTILWSDASNTALDDIFQLQDKMVDRIVQSLTVPLTAQERRVLKRDVPVSAFGYECFLRANKLVRFGGMEQLTLARDLYLRCLEEDPAYAPAWARLGRAYRLLGKFHTEDAATLQLAEDAFRKAFELNPDLAIAHHFYTPVETDSGRSLDAMRRLLARAQFTQNDASLFAGLGHACRYCGLLDVSLAAMERALQIDPKLPVGAGHTYFALRQFDAVRFADGVVFLNQSALAAAGKNQEALQQLRELLETSELHGVPQMLVRMLLAFLEGNRAACLAVIDDLVPRFRDPEALFILVYYLAPLGERDRAIQLAKQTIEAGYWCSPQLREHVAFASLRGNPEFHALVELAESRRQQAYRVFFELGGARLLNVPAQS